MAKLLWNVYAGCYDTIAGLAPYQDMLDEVVAELKLLPGMRVLDAGCGTGALADRLADTHPGIELVGVDMSPSMIERARRRRPWPAGFTFTEGTIDDALGTGPGFDRIASVNVIWALTDPQATLTRMAAGLRDGGRMVHTTPRWDFRAYSIVWRHLRRQTGSGLVRSLLRLPVLLLGGLLNLALVVQSVLLARGPRAKKRWHRDGLVELFRLAGAPPSAVRPCYADQGHLIICDKTPK